MSEKMRTIKENEEVVKTVTEMDKINNYLDLLRTDKVKDSDIKSTLILILERIKRL